MNEPLPHIDRAGRDCGLALVCDRSGRVLSLLENRGCVAPDPAPGVQLSSLVDTATVEKLRAFLEQTYLLGSAFDWELNLTAPDGARTVTAAGVRQGESIIVILAASRDDAARMLERFISVNNELINTVRRLQKQLSATTPRPIDERPDGFGELMRLNNDLVNLQREMAKKNAELAESRRLVQSIIDTTPDAIYLYDLATGRYTFVNHGLERILGYAADEMQALADQMHGSLLHGDDRTAGEQHIAAMSAASDGEVLEWEYRLRSAHDEWRWLRSRERVFERDGRGKAVRILGTAHDVTEQRTAEERLVQMTIIDDMTGLYNRRGLETLSEQSVSRVRREGQTAGILFGDLDGLKDINDTLGHAVGDDAIKDAARVLSEASRASDVVARVGGDEFVLLTFPADEPGMEALRYRLYDEFARINESGSRPYRLEMSIGYALCGPGTTCTLGQVLEQADERMYAEKRRRRELPDG